jgi:hypothetical protein
MATVQTPLMRKGPARADSLHWKLAKQPGRALDERAQVNADDGAADSVRVRRIQRA